MPHKSIDIATAIERLKLTGDVRVAITRLISLVEGDRAILEVVNCGERAIPALRAILWAREPGGLFETRCRAVDALALLGAHDVLIAYLAAPHTDIDPREAVAREAVMNAAARALTTSRDSRVIPLLLRLARQRPLAGIIETLGRLGREEALPFFIDALAEDFSRSAAEAAIRVLGAKARPALLDAAVLRLPSSATESPSSRRRRLSALKLVDELESPLPGAWPPLHDLIGDDDPRIAAVACKLGLAGGDEAIARKAIERLIDLLEDAGWPLHEDIEDYLVQHVDKAKPLISDRLARETADESYYAAGAKTRRALMQVVHRTMPGSAPSDR